MSLRVRKSSFLLKIKFIYKNEFFIASDANPVPPVRGGAVEDFVFRNLTLVTGAPGNQ